MDDAKYQLVDKLKSANNILVTVSRDPSVDQLAGCLGLALLLNKQGKHTAAVFSGQVPSTLEFLEPEDTLEKNTDSLRDFIIALDKSKADKLRYKVEDNVVRIFITPYKTSIGQDDLEFSQGDFNVDLVVALGVASQEDLDEAITAHGRILHDATVASINVTADSGLGSINLRDARSSSLCELITELAKAIDPALLDGQIATALLTGIVSETERFSNDKTSSRTMEASATLMAAGANQQLVASKLAEPEEPEQPPEEPIVDDEPGAEESDQPAEDSNDGTIEIDHDKQDEAVEAPAPEEPAIELPEPDDGQPEEPALPEMSSLSSGSKLITEPPTLGGTLTANSQQPTLDPVTDPMSLPNDESAQLLDHAAPPATSLTPAPLDWVPPAAADPVAPAAPAPDPAPPISDTEQPKPQEEPPVAGLNDARDEVSKALNSADSTQAPAPIEALNAQPLGDDLHPTLPELLSNTEPTPPPSPPTPLTPAEPPQPDNSQVVDPTAPPPVPPPIPFQFGNTNSPQQ